jgi:hypothetical protein
MTKSENTRGSVELRDMRRGAYSGVKRYHPEINV